jgi:hypothetical protein
MAEVTWGRKETIVWPPHKPIYTLGALFLGLIATGFFVYFRFIFVLSPLQQFYLPAYIKTAATASIPTHTKYRMLLMSDAKHRAWYARDIDVEPGSTPQLPGKPIPLQLSDSARQRGIIFLYRSAPMVLSGIGVQQYLRQQVYDGQTLLGMFGEQLVFGGIFFLLQLPWSISKDIRRWKEMKYGRRLKGPILVSPRQFNKAVHGTGIGIKVDQSRDLLRVPERAEDQHFEIIGDTGSGKTTIIMQMLRQIQARRHSAIIYDPACEFIERFYSEARGDIVLNPLDRRCPYWGPSEELVRRAEARTIAASLFQPTNDKKGEFFVESPQKIFAHLLLDLPTPHQLVEWMSHPEEIDRRIKDTELASLIDRSAPQQRSGVLASLSLIADSFRLLPRKEDAAEEWTAREWSKDRKAGSFSPRSRPSARRCGPYTASGSTCSFYAS